MRLGAAPWLVRSGWGRRLPVELFGTPTQQHPTDESPEFGGLTGLARGPAPRNPRINCEHGRQIREKWRFPAGFRPIGWGQAR
jgi:hypothetical protein